MLLLGFNTLGNRLKAQAVGQRQYGADNRQAAGAAGQVTNKRLIDFQLIQRQMLQVGQG